MNTAQIRAQYNAQTIFGALAQGVSRGCVRLLSILLGAWHFISPAFGNHCRFYPSCSVYAKEALQKHGVVRGVWLSTKRVCRCNSLFEGGIDPVP